jgi:hypothetical protein
MMRGGLASANLIGERDDMCENGGAWRLVFAVCLLGWLGGPSLASAQQVEKVERPDFRIGDTWVYDRVDAFKDTRESSIRYRVAKLDGDSVEMEITDAESGKVLGKDIYTRELRRSLRELGSVRVSSEPAYPYLSFPLEIGKRWEQKVTQTRAGMSQPIEVDLEGKVVRWEDVSVKAGSFKAIKVEVSGYFHVTTRMGERLNVSVSDHVWYVPVVKWWVKHTSREEVVGGPPARRGVRRSDVIELRDYRLVR